MKEEPASRDLLGVRGESASNGQCGAVHAVNRAGSADRVR